MNAALCDPSGKPSQGIVKIYIEWIPVGADKSSYD